jgi:hypothetical protein
MGIPSGTKINLPNQPVGVPVGVSLAFGNNVGTQRLSN